MPPPSSVPNRSAQQKATRHAAATVPAGKQPPNWATRTAPSPDAPPHRDGRCSKTPSATSRTGLPKDRFRAGLRVPRRWPNWSTRQWKSVLLSQANADVPAERSRRPIANRAADVEHAVGDRLSHPWVGEVVDADSGGLLLGPPFLAAVGVVANQLLLLAVDGDHPLTRSEVLGSGGIRVGHGGAALPARRLGHAAVGCPAGGCRALVELVLSVALLDKLRPDR